MTDKEAEVASFKAAADYALAAIRGIILINGGAAVALLAFLGGVAGDSPISFEQREVFGTAMVLFGWGAFFGALTAGVAYLSQILFTERASTPAGGSLFRGFAILFAVAAYASFIVGLYKAAAALT